MEGDRELAWLYRRLRDLVLSMPSSVDNILDAPGWFKKQENDEESGVWQMINIADKRAKEILKNKASVGQR